MLQQESDIKIVAEATNSDALSKAVKKHEPNVVIIDYQTAKKSFSIDNINMIKTISPTTQVLVISSDDNKVHILQANKCLIFLFHITLAQQLPFLR